MKTVSDSITSTHQQQDKIISILDKASKSYSSDTTLLKLVDILKLKIENGDLNSDETGIADTLQKRLKIILLRSLIISHPV